MNRFYRLYCRIYQKSLKIISNLIKWPKPQLFSEINSLNQLPNVILNDGLQCVLIVTDNNILNLPFMNVLLDNLKTNQITYAIYSNTIANPTIYNVEDALSLYKIHNCNGIIAIGGGSPIDCAKALGARISNPAISISKMKGLHNAVILPYILESYGSSIYDKLSQLADYINLTPIHLSKKDKSLAFIASIKELNTKMNIPNKINNLKKRIFLY